MKKFSLSVVLTALCLSFSAQAKEPPRLLMLDEICAVPGIECNVYFQNIFKTVNPNGYFFRVDCKKGKLMKRFWTFTPKAQDVGTYDWKITIFNDDGKVAEKTVKLKVLPRKDIPDGLSIMMLGDSLTDQSHYVHRLKKLAPALGMIGVNGGGGKSPAQTGIAHEGYGGWAWSGFVTERKPIPLTRLKYRKNMFLFNKNGKWCIDLEEYFKRYSNGKKPDIVTIQLGGNDITISTDQNIDKTLEGVARNMDKLIKILRRSLPNAIIGIGLVPCPADQNAFGHDYACQINSYQFMKNRWKINQLYIDKVAAYAKTDKKISLIPVVHGIDPENAYPTAMQSPNSHTKRKVLRQINALHPTAEGGAQMGDIYYCWLLDRLSQK